MLAGATFTVIGERLGYEIRAIVALIDSDIAASVLYADDDSVTILVPTTLRAGPHTLHLAIRGTALRPVTFTVVDESERKQRSTLVIDTANLSSGSLSVTVTGHADLPNGTVLELTVIVTCEPGRDYPLATTVTTQDQHFEGRLGPCPAPIQAGIYTVHVKFDLSQQATAIQDICHGVWLAPHTLERRSVDHARKTIRVPQPRAGTTSDEQPLGAVGK